jgi:hypothetical protein
LRLAYYRDSERNFRVLRPAYYRGIQRTGRPGTREKEIGFEREPPRILVDRAAASSASLGRGPARCPGRSACPGPRSRPRRRTAAPAAGRAPPPQTSGPGGPTPQSPGPERPWPRRRRSRWPEAGAAGPASAGLAGAGPRRCARHEEFSPEKLGVLQSKRMSRVVPVDHASRRVSLREQRGSASAFAFVPPRRPQRGAGRSRRPRRRGSSRRPRGPRRSGAAARRAGPAASAANGRGSRTAARRQRPPPGSSQVKEATPGPSACRARASTEIPRRP